MDDAVDGWIYCGLGYYDMFPIYWRQYILVNSAVKF